MPAIAGIDEAGRGPLIGDMFMTIIVMKSDGISILEKLGVKDSKRLSKSQRAKLFPYIILNSLIVSSTRATPQQIDSKNLNVLEIEMVCKLIKNAVKFYPIDTIYIDAFSEPRKLRRTISLTCNIPENKLIIEYKADSRFLIVSAASIVAKFLRDSHIEMLKKVYGEFGSGYPSDYRTVLWIKQYFKEHRQIPSIVRRSWKTINKMIF